MSSATRRSRRTVSALAAGSVALLAACGSSTSGTSSSSAAAGASSGSAAAADLPKTLVFSPLSLAPPALKGLSEGVKGYAGSKGWQVLVQDPNFDATKQTQQLNEVLDSGRAGAAWSLRPRGCTCASTSAVCSSA